MSVEVDVEGDSIIIRERALYISEWKEVELKGRLYIIQKHGEGIITIYVSSKPNFLVRLVRWLR